MDGILIIDKEKGITSRDVVNSIVKKFNIKKVGHTGTLDPIATGVLVICIGSATKLVDELTSSDKEYIATVKLGVLTDTLDSDGKILEERDSIVSREDIENVLKSFIGNYLQEVPIYSAIKVNGKKLYEYARCNESVDIPKRNVNIKDISLLEDIKYENDKTIFKFKCTASKGTYIRSLVRDIAVKLNTIGIMTDLRRIRQGNFKIEDSIKLENISRDSIISIIDCLDIDKIELNKDIEKKVLNGAYIDDIYGKDKLLFIKNNEAIAIYIKKEDKLKPYKMFKGGVL